MAAVRGAVRRPRCGRPKPSNRLDAGFKAALYGFIAFGILKYALGLGTPKSSNKQTVDLTSTAMREPGGRILVGIVGVVLIGVGAWLAWRAFEKKFVEEIKTGEMSPRTRRAVVAFGRVGGIARGIAPRRRVALPIAAVTAHMRTRPRASDATLRAFTKTPASTVVARAHRPYLVIIFGVYSSPRPRWRRVKPRPGCPGWPGNRSPGHPGVHWKFGYEKSGRAYAGPSMPMVLVPGTSQAAPGGTTRSTNRAVSAAPGSCPGPPTPMNTADTMRGAIASDGRAPRGPKIRPR